ncbi:MAG: hypothetical protein EXX96DRAFT_490211 [Benjaminiella poitrasii]|nr:MAG: hypothetical protein EXX96DRAFT_490211 [Benjaminiella poitrasii]
MLKKYLRVDYTDEIRETLVFPNVNNLKKLIVPGTVAETMLTTMSKFNKTRSAKASLDKFYEVANNFKASGIRQKSAKMMQEIAHEEAERVQKKLKRNITFSNNDKCFSMPEINANEREDESKKSFWQAWKKFLINARKNSSLPSLSPEKHGAIWFGQDLHRRPSLPEALYSQTRQESIKIKQYDIDNSYKETIMNIILSADREQMLESVSVLRSMKSDAPEWKLLVDFFTLFGEQIYDDVGAILTESEACFNSGLVQPSLQACVRMLRNSDYNITYLPGEVELTSMTV